MRTKRTHGSPLDRNMLTDEDWTQIANELGLSNRELQIVLGIFDDQTECAIARQHGISPHTVHSHLQRLYRKLNVSGRSQLVQRVFAAYMSLTGNANPSTA